MCKKRLLSVVLIGLCAVSAASGAMTPEEYLKGSDAERRAWMVDQTVRQDVLNTFRRGNLFPRMIRWPGILNVRTLGGLVGCDGRKLKDGMIYRSAKFNENTTYGGKDRKEDRELYRKGATPIPGKPRMPAERIPAFLHAFPLKTELDLRNDSEVKGMEAGSPLGSSVRRVNIPSSAYGGMAKEEGKKAFAECFRIFLDPDNYPIDIHCSGGKDRTGSLVAILEGCLGVDERDICLDWELSAFAESKVNPAWTHERLFDKLIAVFGKYDGTTLNERIVSYVLSCGFTRNDIETLRSIMLERQEGFDVVEESGRLTVRDGDRILISGISVSRDGLVAKASTRRSVSVTPTGARVWNIWDETRDGRYRLEVARHPNGEVEISLLAENDAFAKVRSSWLNVEVPKEAFEGLDYRALKGDGRDWRECAGRFDNSFKSGDWRFLAVGGNVWDFNPIGAGDYRSGMKEGNVRGVWRVMRNANNGFSLRAGSSCDRTVSSEYVGTKLVLRKGGFDDYSRFHFLKSLHYQKQLPHSCLVSFGASRRGPQYADGANLWTKGVPTRISDSPEGAFYSAFAGHGEGACAFGGLGNGIYLVTVKGGNLRGHVNKFSVFANGQPFARDVVVEKGTLREFCRPVRVTDGRLELSFTGDYLVSVIGLQPLLADAEDYSVSRGYWVSKGYEPSVFYRDDWFASEPDFVLSDEVYELPEPGTETVGRPSPPPAPVELPGRGETDWLIDATMQKSSDLSGILAAPERNLTDFGRILDHDLCGNRYDVYMIWGLHTRFAFSGGLAARSVRAIAEMASEVHGRGMKFFDHHDVPVLWNDAGGFRELLRRTPKLVRGVTDGLPSFQMCPTNPSFRKEYFAYAEALAKAGVDGFQLDEVEFWKFGCGCAHCRKLFRKQTGWCLPMNECDARLSDPNGELYRRWYDWRRKTITNWFVALRRHLRNVRPNLILTMYSTNWGFLASLPERGASNDLIDLGRTFNWFGTEVMTRNPFESARALVPMRKAVNTLNRDYGAPIWTWNYGNGVANHYLSWAIANMHGQVALLPDSQDDGGYGDFRAFSVSSDNMRRRGAEPVAEVAILYSAASRDWSGSEAYVRGNQGVAQELECMHVPYEMVSDLSCVRERLSKYKVLYVGAAKCLGDSQIAAIRTFAADGGTVVLEGEVGACDELGLRRRQSGFAEFCHAGRTVLGKGAFVYRDFIAGEKLYYAEVNPAYGLKLCDFNPNPDERTAFRAFLCDITGSAAWWNVEAPEKVYLNPWREADGTLVVHVLNAQACDLRHGERSSMNPPEEAFPELRKDITFVVPEVSHAVAISPDFAGERDLSVIRLDGKRSRVILPTGLLKVYTLVRMK